MRILIRSPVSELVHVRFAEQDRSRAREAGGNNAIHVRNKTGENLRTGGCADALRPKIILQRDGNAAKKARRIAPPPALEFTFRSPGFTPRPFCRHRKKRIESGIQALDSRERVFHQIERGDFSTAQKPRRLRDRKKRQLASGACSRRAPHQKIFSWRRRVPIEPRFAMRNETRY